MLENVILPFDRALRTLTGTVSPTRPTPGERIAEADLTAHERRDAAQQDGNPVDLRHWHSPLLKS